jgi:hypothetical protein
LPENFSERQAPEAIMLLVSARGREFDVSAKSQSHAELAGQKIFA